MNFIELVHARHSVRKYKNREVENKIIEQCIEAARYAPSACNSQPWKFVIVDNPELRNKVAQETMSFLGGINKFSLQAPAMVVIVIEKSTAVAQIGGRLKNKDYYLYDIGIAAEHFCLQATELGLGTCMIGWFNEKAIKKLLKVPDKRSIGLVITIGYPEDNFSKTKIRKDFSEIISYNSY